MDKLIRNALNFFIGRRMYRGAARMAGFGRLAMVAGIIGGIRFMRKHS